MKSSNNNVEGSRIRKWSLKEKLASLILIERTYLIAIAFFYPLIILSLAGVNILFGYIIFLILGIFLIYYFVISNKLIEKSKHYFKVFFPLSTGIFFFIVITQIIAFISNIISQSMNLVNIIFFVFTVCFAVLFVYNIRIPIFFRLNQLYILKVRTNFEKIHIRINLSILLIFISLFLVNYVIPVYNFSFPARERKDFEIGFWTYGAPLDDQPYEDTGLEHLSNEALDFMGKNNIYIIFGITDEALDSENKDIWPDGYLKGHLNFTDRLQRCKDNGVKVHICINHRYWDKPYTFSNIWTIEDTLKDCFQLKELLETYNLWKNPVDTLVFDIEPVIAYYTSFYGLLNPKLGNPINNMDKLRYYNEIIEEFIDNIEIFVKDWEINIELCHIGMDLYDKIDGDDDLHRIWGLIDAETNENIQRSYMIYRGDLLSQKFLIDSMDMMNDNDIVIISAFDEGSFYHDDVNFAINDGLLVKNYPKKDLHLQVWCLYRFINAYGEDAIIDFIKGVKDDAPAYYSLSNIYSFINDALYFFYLYIDIFFSGFLFILKVL